MNPWHTYIIYRPTFLVVREIGYSSKLWAQRSARSAALLLGTEFFHFEVRGPGDKKMIVGSRDASGSPESGDQVISHEVQTLP